MDWLNDMDSFEKTFWYIALPFSIFFALQTILTMFGVMGGGASTDFDGDIDTDSDAGFDFQILSLKNFVVFFTVFSWTGIVAYDGGLSQGMTIFVATLAALGVVFVFALITYFTYKLAESGNFKLSDTVGAIGTVYIPIKAKREGVGKVQITVNGGMRELEAMTDSESDLATSSVIVVEEVFNNQLLIVKKSK